MNGKTLFEELGHKLHGDFRHAVLTLLAQLETPHDYWAERLYKSMKGLGTSDNMLIRLVVSRCEVCRIISRVA